MNTWNSFVLSQTRCPFSSGLFSMNAPVDVLTHLAAFYLEIQGAEPGSFSIASNMLAISYINSPLPGFIWSNWFRSFLCWFSIRIGFPRELTIRHLNIKITRGTLICLEHLALNTNITPKPGRKAGNSYSGGMPCKINKSSPACRSQW